MDAQIQTIIPQDLPGGPEATLWEEEEPQLNGVSIIIPIFNEAENIPELAEALTRSLNELGMPWEVIYIDDGSTDGSYALLDAEFRRDPERVRVLRFRRNYGQTAAIAAGFDAARFDVVTPMDADLQNDPADIGPLIEKLCEDYDVVSGWRHPRHDALITRRLPSHLANMLISWFTGVRLHDYGCTLKAYRHEVVANMHLYGELHRFLPALASWSGARVAEVTVHHHPRKRGKSKYGLDRTMRVILDLITVKFLLTYSTKPMQIFGRWGFLCALLGFISGLITAAEKVFPPYLSVNHNGWLFLAIFFLLGGLQLIGLGLLGEITVRTYYESQHKPIYTLRNQLSPKQPKTPKP